LENRRSEDDKVSRRVWEAMEGKARKIRVGKTKERKKERSKKRKRKKGKKEEIKSRKNDRD